MPVAYWSDEGAVTRPKVHSMYSLNQNAPMSKIQIARRAHVAHGQPSHLVKIKHLRCDAQLSFQSACLARTSLTLCAAVGVFMRHKGPRIEEAPLAKSCPSALVSSSILAPTPLCGDMFHYDAFESRCNRQFPSLRSFIVLYCIMLWPASSCKAGVESPEAS